MYLIELALKLSPIPLSVQRKELGDAKSLYLSIKESLKKAGLYQGVKSVKILELWPKIVGEKIANKTEANYINNGTLFVEVSNSTWRQELQFQKQKIIKKLNQKLKKKIIRELIFK